MPKLSSLLLKIPDEFKPFAALGIGALILVCLVLFHGVSLHRILVLHRRAEAFLRSGRPHVWTAEMLFAWSVFLMLALHLIEIMTWAFALVHMGLILRPADSIYFCANAYTTLGYGTVDLGTNWRNISPIIAISGLFTFAWTTSSLVGMVASHIRLLEQLDIERTEEREMRADELRVRGLPTRRRKAPKAPAGRTPRSRPAQLHFSSAARFGRKRGRKKKSYARRREEKLPTSTTKSVWMRRS